MNKEELFIILLLIGVLVFGGIAALAENDQWSKFKADYNCKITSQTSSTSSLAVGINTQGGATVVPIVTPGETGYMCDDGVTYYR